ncbi:MAG: serine/threonine protein kinase [Ideonella sp.]|nr:serine/threonine protein kinase [Ideonella sp.]MCC7456166.1 serine/threonine protein kinase [Nitrospira sp.]
MSTSTLLDAARRGAAPAAPDASDAANALPVGQRLHEFEIRGVVGVGGFGIVYRAFDHTLEREVAIKEYMPSALAGRSAKLQVSLLSASHSETFALGLGSFINEAKLLARFDHPSLVKVHRFWEDNGTAYMVMPLYRGTTLRALRQASSRAPDEAWLRQLLEHLLGALEVMHREGVFHRDIAPDNILVADGAPPVLLDFGAARRVISDRSQSLTAILKPHYAPLEQYAESTGMRQGPWTDFYALGATLHYLIIGKPPMPATARALTDDQPRLAGSNLGGLSDALLQVCDWMLAPRPQDRPQNAAELRAALAGRLPVPQRAKPEAVHAWERTAMQGASAHDDAATTLVHGELPLPQARATRRTHARTFWTLATAMVAIAAAGVWWTRADDAIEPAPVKPAAAAVTPIESADATARAAAAAAVAAATQAATAAPTNTVPAVPAATMAPAAAAANPASATATPSATAMPAAESPLRLGASTRPATRVRLGGARAAIGGDPAATVAGTPTPMAMRELAYPPDGAAAAAPALPPAAPPAMTRAANGTANGAAIARNPKEHCGGRHLIALHRCLVRECAKSEYSAHRDCQRVRDIEAARDRLTN